MLNLKLLPKNSVFLWGLAAVTSVALLSWLNIPPLSLGFLLLFVYWFYKTRCNICIEMSSEFQVQCQKILDQLKNWKETKPAAFCVITSICLAILAMIGHFISGSIVVLFGLAFAALLSTKYNFQMAKRTDYHKDLTKWSGESIKEFEVEDEFMPEINETNFIVLESAADSWSSKSFDKIENKNTDTDENSEESDEIPAELLLSPDELPEIHENSSDNDDENDEQNDSLSLPAADLFKYAIDQENSISTSSSGSAITNANDNNAVQFIDDDGIQFKKAYFKKDATLSTLSTLSTSTTSSEESLPKELQFPDYTTVTATAAPSLSSQQEQHRHTCKTPAETLLSHTSKLLLPGFMSGIMHGLLGTNINPIASLTNVAKGQESESKANNRNYKTIDDSASSDESDFELINNSDLN